MSWIFSVDGNYVNFNGGSNLYRLHKDSNCIAWHFDETGDLFFDVYDQQYSVKAENIGTVIINGVPLSAASDFGDAIVAVFPGLGGGSPGGSSYLVKAEVTLTDAQIKALPTTPIQIIAAQGSGKVIQLINAVLLSDVSGGDYSGIDGDCNIYLANKTDGEDQYSQIISESDGSVTNLLTETLNYSNQIKVQLLLTGSNTASPYFAPISRYDNEGMYLYAFNGDVFGGGNAANTLKVTVYYVVVDL